MEFCLFVDFSNKNTGVIKDRRLGLRGNNVIMSNLEELALRTVFNTNMMYKPRNMRETINVGCAGERRVVCECFYGFIYC